MSDIKTHNDLVYALAEKAKKLANSSMYELRLSMAKGDAMSPSAVYREVGKTSRGQLVEDILLEEYIIERDRDFEVT